MKKISSEKLLRTYGDRFKDLYLSGKTVEEIKVIMKLSHHYAYMLKRLLYLHLERWQRVGMPKKFSKQTESLIYGTLMGDASIHTSGNNKYKIFSISHSYKQIKYLEHKRNLLKDLIPYSIKELHDEWNTNRFVTPPHPQFDNIYQLFYGSGSKQITLEILSKLTPQAIALWFMDDGSLEDDCSGFRIATCDFNSQSIKNICEFFLKEYDIKFTVYNYKNDYPRIALYSNNAIKFKKLISKFVIRSMKYKLKLKAGVGIRSHYQYNK